MLTRTVWLLIILTVAVTSVIAGSQVYDFMFTLLEHFLSFFWSKQGVKSRLEESKTPDYLYDVDLLQ